MLVQCFNLDMLCIVFMHGAMRETYRALIGLLFPLPGSSISSLLPWLSLPRSQEHCQTWSQTSGIYSNWKLLAPLSQCAHVKNNPKEIWKPKVTAINHTCSNAIFISESGLPFVSCPANIPNCWPFVHKRECKVHALESWSNTSDIICSYGQAGTAHIYHFIPRKENEPETVLKEMQFVARECHSKFYSCLMLDNFSGRSPSVSQSWLICPLWVMLINLACFSLVELYMKWSGFLQAYLLFIRILRIVWTNTFQFATHVDDLQFTFCGLWFVFQVKCYYVSLPVSGRNFINRKVTIIE